MKTKTLSLLYRNRGCTTGITKSLFVKSINSDYLYVKFKNLRLW